MLKIFVFIFIMALILNLLPFFIFIAVIALLVYFGYKLYIKLEEEWFENFQNEYYKSEDFLVLKSTVIEHIDNCNELNAHIETLKTIQIKNIRNLEGKSVFYDSSDFNYKRPEYKRHIQKSNVYNCSRAICDNARMQPFKYVCKYFDIKCDEESLRYFENLLNQFSSAEDGIKILCREKEKILNSVNDKVPDKIKNRAYGRFQYELGFSVINFEDIIFPKYTFLYVSPGGNASTSCDVVMNIENLNKFILFISDKIDFRKSVAGQRALMTSSLRQKILKRDNYTCCTCGVSIKDEPTLLLEIDHIYPLSKGGMTTEDNLQTLCWKCNRSKSNKLQ